MENKLLVNINMFDINQTVFLIKDDKKVENFRVSLADLLKHISATLDAEDISEIDFEGHTLYVKQITEDLAQILKTKYANRNVRILINGEVFTE